MRWAHVPWSSWYRVRGAGCRRGCRQLHADFSGFGGRLRCDLRDLRETWGIFLFNMFVFFKIRLDKGIRSLHCVTPAFVWPPMQCHPDAAVLATSGIENVIRLWTPGDVCTALAADKMASVVSKNQVDSPSTASAHTFQRFYQL